MNPDETDVVPEKMDLNIVFEDADLMLINKLGMMVHPAAATIRELVEWCAFYLKEQNPTTRKKYCQDSDWTPH